MAASLNEVFDVLIIGCGAVGAAVAREMALLGQKCIVLEKNMDVLSEASSGNTGHLVRIFLYMSFLWVTNCILLPKLF
jgi:glycine/D-amino acid oxidase-like deaminating enzyme